MKKAAKLPLSKSWAKSWPQFWEWLEENL